MSLWCLPGSYIILYISWVFIYVRTFPIWIVSVLSRKLRSRRRSTFWATRNPNFRAFHFPMKKKQPLSCPLLCVCFTRLLQFTTTLDRRCLLASVCRRHVFPPQPFTVRPPTPPPFESPPATVRLLNCPHPPSPLASRLEGVVYLKEAVDGTRRPSRL